MNRKLMSIASAFALVANSLVAVGQNPVPDKSKTEKQEIRINREVKIISDGSPNEQTMFFAQSTNAGAMPMFADGQGENFSFATSQIHLEAKSVKGKPYSADIVNEHIQTLGDGNRITRKSNSTVARDSEGRIRQEANLQAFGPFAEAIKDLPKHISIFDPVLGSTFILNPKNKTAFNIQKIEVHIENFMENSKSDSQMKETKVTVKTSGGTMENLVGGEAAIQRVSGGVLAAKAISKSSPKYPAEAKAAGIQGTVLVKVVVNEKGEVISEDVVGGHPLLAVAATEAAHQWKFQPTILNGQPVKMQGTLTFNFTLNDTPPAGIVTKIAPASLTKLSGLESQDIKIFTSGNSKYEKKTEPLGKQILEGLECEGIKNVMIIPAGELGNDNPINVVTETWISTDLQVTLLRKFNDPRFGEDVYRLTNINRTEPDKELFKVPADYKIEERINSSPTLLREFNGGEPGVNRSFKMRKPIPQEDKIIKEQ